MRWYANRYDTGLKVFQFYILITGFLIFKLVVDWNEAKILSVTNFCFPHMTRTRRLAILS